MISRRMFSAALLAVPALWSVKSLAADTGKRVEQQLAELERRHGGRLGVAILDTGSSRLIAHRGDQRFALCSTFKALAAGLVLARVDARQEDLSRRVVYRKEQLVPYSPATEKHTGAQGMSMAELCEAAVTLSDNTAANLLLESVGGPEGLTTWLRSLGDQVTRLDRNEPTLNQNLPNDPRDTTTPIAMLHTLRKLVLGDALSPGSRKQLRSWLRNNTTGDQKLRAGVPKGWQVGDKTGSGAHNASNDIAVIRAPGRAPIIVTVYYSESRASSEQINAVMAEVGRLAASI